MKEFKNHTFAISAYKESPYLEECIKSVLNQKVKSNVIICTATPNKHIDVLANKYNIPLYIRNGKPDIQDDWNFAYSNAKTQYVTITHQDDLYNEEYTSNIMDNIDSKEEEILIFTGYREIKNGEIIPLTVNLKIKKFMLFPLIFKVFQRSKFIRKRILSLGSPICCPAVTYNKKIAGDKVFTSKMKCSLDWDTWYKFSKEKGRFAYISKELVYHRIHEQSETTNAIANNVRQSEDLEMFKKFWPDSIANMLSKAYSKSLDTNNV